MAKTPQRTPIPGPAFIRLLARLSNAELPGSTPALTDRLSTWIDWTRAVALSRALDGQLSAEADDTDVPVFDASAAQEVARVRAVLVLAITSDVHSSAKKSRPVNPGPDEGLNTSLDFTPYRERYRDLQQSMQAETGRLRGRLRDMLASQSTSEARLAEVDAVMEATLSTREHDLLAIVPALLEQHFDRLRASDGEPPAASQHPAVAIATPPLWISRFQQDIRDVLLAELDVRFQPVEGLLAALRTR